MPEVNINNIVEDTLNLVQTKSITGNTVEVAGVYEKKLKEAGCTVKRYEFIRDNPTLVARFGKARENEKKLIFNGHMDVVPLEQSEAYVKNERIYGRGTCDMKGSLAAILEVIRSIHSSQAELSGEIIIIANSLHESPYGRGEDLTELVEKEEDLKADAAVVMEGATYDCTIAQIGSTTFNLTIEREGNPSHQLYTAEGTPHPISVMSDVIDSLDEKNKELNNTYIKDIGYGSYFIGKAASGEFYNQMPKMAVLEGVRRYGPEQTFEDVVAELQSLMDKVAKDHGVDIHVDMRKVRDGYRVDRDADILNVLANTLKKIRGLEAPFIGKKLVTDAGIIANGLNIPVVCSGPDQQQAHAEEEFVELNELHLSAKIYMDLIQTYVGLKE